MTSEEEGRREGERGKQEGMDRAERAADEHWKRCMLISGKNVAERMAFFTTDDIERVCMIDFPDAWTHEKRATGPIMRSMARMKYCVKTQDFVPSVMASCHCRDKRIWYSLIYKGPPMRKPRRRKFVDPRQLVMDNWA